MILGIDASTYFEEIDHGAVYKKNGKTIDPLLEFRRNGVDWFRIRLWNDPYSEDGEPYLAGTCDLKSYIRLAERVKELGYHILLDFHYSDFWADPGKQMIPKAWRGMVLDELAESIYNFTKRTLITLKEVGLAPEMVAVGNEITNGFLWPMGKLDMGGGVRGNYESFLKLLSSGVAAVREVLPSAEIMLHLERSNDREVYREFFKEVTEAGIDFDIIGASYYPYWHGTPEELFFNLKECRDNFSKKIMVAELGYGFTTKPYSLDGEKKRLVIDEERAYIEGFTDKYPISAQGQAAFVRDFLRGARENGIDGIFYWEPLWLPGEGICWASEAGQNYIGESGKSTANEWANQCLFDYEGEMLPAFSEFSHKIPSL